MIAMPFNDESRSGKSGSKIFTILSVFSMFLCNYMLCFVT